MNVVKAGAGGKAPFLAVLAVLAVGVACVVAAEPEKKAAPSEKKDATPEKRVAFGMDGKPWDAVFKWLADQTGKEVHYSFRPTGTFAFIGPEKKTYTIPEVIDIINGGLLSNSQTQKYYLINGDQAFFVVPADEKIDPYLVPHLEGPDDFAKHGETEIVQMELPLTSLNAEDMAPRIGQIMGPFHESVAMPGNELHLQDTVRNLKRVVSTLKRIENSETKQTDSYSHECKYILARDAEKTLKTLLGEPQPAPQAQPTREREREREQPQPMAQPMGPPMGPPGAPPGTPAATPPGAPPAATPSPTPNPSFPAVPSRPAHTRMFYITSDDAKNLILVTGPPEIIAKAKDIVEKLDKPSLGQQPILIGPPSFKTIPVPDGNADSLAKDLSAIYPPSSTLRITASGANSLRVYACPEDMDAIERQIGEIGKGVKGVLIDVGGVDAAKAATTLQAMYGTAAAGGPYIEAQPDQNAVLVRGTPTQVQEIRDLMKVMNGESAAAPGVGPAPSVNASTTRVITLDSGSGAAVADELKRLLQQMRANPVHVISPGAGPDDGGEKKPRPPMDMPHAPGATWRPAADVIRVAQKPGDAPLVDPQDKKDVKKDDKPGNAEQPVIIAASGNKIIITSQDPGALAMAQQLVRLMTQTTAGEGDFEVIRLKNALATEAAKLLDQAFNEPKAAAQPQGGPGGFGGGLFSRFAAANAQPPTNPTPNRIRVVADPTTNSLLVRAKPVDMLTIRWLLAKAIDNNDKEQTAGPQTHIVTFKYARADDVYDLLAKVYKDQIDQNPGLQDLQNLRGFTAAIAGSKNNNLDANGQPRPVTLNLAVDEQSNSLVVKCTDALFTEVKQLTDHMDAAAKDNTRTVRVVQLKGVDPALIQEAVDAIQGHTTSVIPTTTAPAFGQGTGTGTGIGAGAAGFQPGGGGGGPPPRRRGPQQRSPEREGRGPDFFEHRVMDDPQPSSFYDPQQDAETLKDGTDAAVRAAAYEQQQPAPEPAEPPPTRFEDLPAPRAGVTVQPLPGLGLYIVTANNPADADAIANLIIKIGGIAPSTEFQIEMVHLAKGDATSIANTLTQLYQRVNISPGGNIQNATVKRTTQTQQGPVTEEALSSVVMIPVPRLNALLVAAPKSRIKDVERDVKDLDTDNAAADQATPFHLRKASAARVGTLLTNFYAQRYAAGNEGANQHQVRITFDTSSNVVFVVAAPADMTEIRELIEHLDTDVTAAVNNLRIKYLRHTAADDIANLLQRAITDSVAPPIQPPAGTGAGAGGGAGAGAPAPGGGAGAPGAGAGVPGGGGFPGAGGAGGAGAQGFRPGGAGAGATGGGAAGAAGATGAAGAGGATSAAFTAGGVTKSTSLKFIDPKTGKVVESGMLEDIFITPDENSNSLLISAPDKTMELLDSLIDALDVAPAAQYVVKVLTLKKSDATAVANLLQQLFLGTSGSTGTGGAGAGAGAPRPGGAGGIGTPGAGGFGGAGAAGAATSGPTTGGTLSTAGGTGGNGRPLQLTLSGLSPGVQLTDLRITIDERSNSLIVAGGPSDIDIIQAIIAKLESGPETNDLAMRRNEVYKLRNSTATDVANALNSFLTNSINVLKINGVLTPFQDIEREVVVVPEPITNTLLISATPRYFDEVMRLVAGLDAEAPQVVVQVLIAEVDLTNEEEFGVELGLQSPVLFQRSIFPALNAFGPNGSVNYTNATGGLVPPGVTVNTSLNPSAQPGFNFNNPSLPLGNNPLISPQVIGTQGLTNLGVGTVSPTQGVSGFVFQAQSDFFNLLIRALKVQGRIDVLSRPQVTALDNQQARVFVGQNFPIVLGSNVTATGVVSNNINYQPVGVQLVITPRITPDGRVIMRVTPEVSSTSPTNVSLGNGVTATAINQQIVDTTVVSMDGETVALGGLITKRDTKAENKVPYFGDLPYIGAAFRYRTQTKAKTELLVIMTPHIVRSRADADRILAQESKRMDWLLDDVARTQGLSGMAPVLHPKAFVPPTGPGGVDGCLPSPLMQPTAPTLPYLPPAVTPAPVGPETLPPPRVVPGGDQGPSALGPVAAPPAAPFAQPALATVQGLPPAADAPTGPLVPPPDGPPGPAIPAAVQEPPPPPDEPKMETARWRLFKWN